MATQERPIGFWLKLVDQLVDEQFGASFEEHGVTRLQWQMMNVLTSGPVTEKELADQLRPFFPPVETGTSAELIEELADSGWVEVNDGTYALTDLGTRSLENLRGAVERIREQLTSEVSEEEYAALVTVLQRMASNLGWEDRPDTQDTPGL
ncbi:MarR family winged helix-turn-helix transcriptional regulator [Arthrobacter caoxuetaonis]|uniref:MarR family winged helix-turn-helix transcriptional regulator n=1 Tax=Arthrobacter caoxuetaonis TaxID=2886935 RepID=UPI001D139E6B|nr:MarR family winged helix-turn-helix transcriptional regulator [Arthrobacter caoxuetaonis]MCC3284040.1 MarR family winged helix-turn-helix transcriptional regulator [Arthrobacter caoxuetaonis]